MPLARVLSLLRNLPWLFVLAIAFSTVTVPVVSAQTTSITNLEAPSTASVGQPVRIRVGATYNLGPTGYAVLVGIFDLDAWWAIGTAASTQSMCHPYTGPSGQEAFCTYIPSTTSGSDVVIFQLIFSSVKTYRLRASVELFYSNAQLISGSSTFQDFSIVVSETSALSQTTQITSSQQAPTSTTSQPAYDATQPWLAFAIIAMVVLGALIVYLRRGKKFHESQDR